MTLLRSARVPAVLGLAVAGMLAAPLAAPASATTSHCLIINAAADTSYTSLQAAQNAASPGATLWVRGTCTGTTQITKSLTLTGQHPAGFTAPTLSGGGQGSTLAIGVAGAAAVTVTINTLTITGGNVGTGGGIFNFAGTLTLNDSSITGNTAKNGGGIFAEEGSVTLNDSSITGNTASGPGGGILIASDNVTLNGSSIITGNTASGGGGIYNSSLNTPPLGVTATNVTGNTPDNCEGPVPGCVN